MKSLLVTNGTQRASLAELTRGDYAIVKADGTVVATSGAVPTTGMYKYVVGLGDGKVIEGLWLNADNHKKSTSDYSPGAKKQVIIGTVEFDVTRAMEATVHIQTQPKNALAGLDYQEFVATVPVRSTTDESTLPAKLLAEVQKVVANINTYFGKNVIKLTGTALNGLQFDAESTDFNFYVNFGGAAIGTTTSTDGITFGTKDEIVKLEKEMAISTFGYNPNFEAGDHAYGNVLLAEELFTAEKKVQNTTVKGFDVHIISSVAPSTDAMPLNPEGAKVEQWIAVLDNKTVKVKA